MTKNELRYGGLSLSLLHIPARFRSFVAAVSWLRDGCRKISLTFHSFLACGSVVGCRKT